MAGQELLSLADYRAELVGALGAHTARVPTGPLQLQESRHSPFALGVFAPERVKKIVLILPARAQFAVTIAQRVAGNVPGAVIRGWRLCLWCRGQAGQAVGGH